MRNVLVAVMVLALNWLQCPILAQEVPADPLPDATSAAQSAAATAADTSLNLNLSSTVASMTAPASMTSPVNVNLGGVMTSIAPGSAVTPAQMVALHQVMRTGVQSLVLDSLGAAQGGTMTIGSHLSSMLGSLTIPSGVTVLSNAASAGPINLTGNLVNSGSFYLYSTNAATTSASVSALNILNNQGAMLSTVLPATLQASLPSALSSLNLNLSAINNIVNAGTIASSGNLNLYAGGSISNIGANAVMQAMQSLALTSMSGNITNSGLMASVYGNINVDAVQVANMTVNNLGGVMQALNGSINFRDQAYAGAANISLLGGDYLSKVLNLHGGLGAVDLNVGNVTGVINAWGQCVRVTADAPLLQLGTIYATGDPYVAVTGDLDLGPAVFAPYLVAVAGQNIFTSQSNTSILTGGGNLVLAAGAVAINASGTCPNCIFLDRSEAGGDIFLTTGRNFGPFASQNILALETSSASVQGGNLTLIAFADSQTGQTRGGHVALAPGVIVRTDGNGSFANGNLTIIAEAANGLAIGMGGVNSVASTFGSGGGGMVTLNVATPNAGPVGPTVDTTNGNISGTFTSGDLQNGSIMVGQIVTGGAFADATHMAGSVSVSTNGAITAGGINTAGIAGVGAPRNTAFNGNAQSGGNGGNGSNINLSAGGVIAAQSIVSFGGGGGGGAGATVDSSLIGGEGGSGGSGGDIFISTTSTAANSIFITGDVNSSGGGGGGGGGGSITTGFTRQAGPGGDGGVGGDAGAIAISASSVAVTGGLYAVGGGEGGAGMVGTVQYQFDSPAGGGGGGGGSYGGAGGGGGGGSGKRLTGGGASESGAGGGGGISYDGAGFGEGGLYTTTLSFQWGGAGGGGLGYSQNLSNTPAGTGGGGGQSGGFNGVPLLPPGESGFNAGGAGESGSSNSISLHTDALSVSDAINAKNNLVEITPYSATSIIFGGSGSTPSVLYLDSPLLLSITAGTVSVGSSAYAGGIFVAADTSVPYDLIFLTNSAGGIETISGVLSTNSLTINAGYIGGTLQPLVISVPNLSTRSSSGDVNIVDNTSVNLFNSGAAAGIVIDFHILVPVSGGTITIQSPIVVDGAGGQIHLSADGDILDPSGSALQADNINLSGNNIGDIDHPLYVAAGSPGGVVNLSLDSANDYIVDTNPGESINLGPINSTGSITILENGSITVSGPISITGALTLTSILGSNGSIQINAPVDAFGPVNLTADGTGIIGISNTLNSHNNDITLTASNILASAPIDAGQGTVFLIPNSNEDIIVNGVTSTPAGKFYVTGGGTGLLDQISAAKVVVGSPSLTGSTTLANTLNLGPGNYVFDVQFANNGPFNANGHAINTNSQSLAIASAEAIILASVRAINGSVTLVSGRDIRFTNIDTSSSTGNGGNIVMVAGARFDSIGTTITVDGSSGFGGSILQNSGGDTLRSYSTAAAGGKIVMVANESITGGDGTGTIVLQPLTEIYTSGSGNLGGSPSGDVVVIAGGNTGSSAAISIDGIYTWGGTAGTGNIVLVSADSSATTNDPVSINSDTGALTGDFCCGQIQNGSVFVSSITGNGGSTLTLKAGNTAQVLSIVLDGTTGQNGGSLVFISGFTLNTPQGFAYGGAAPSTIGSLSVAPGSGATTYGDIKIVNYGPINILQTLRAEKVELSTVDLAAVSTGPILDPGNGTSNTPSIYANTILLKTLGTGGPNNNIGMTVTNNGNPKVDLVASSSNGSVTIKVIGNVSIADSSGAGDDRVFDLQVAGGSAGSIAINHDVIVGGSSGIINLTADGAGTITRPNGLGTLMANTVNLSTGSGDLGSDPFPIDMITPNFTFNTTGSVYLQSVGSFVLPVINMDATKTFSFRTNPDSNGYGSIMLTSNGSNPTISAGNVKLIAYSGAMVGFISQQAPSTVASISAKTIFLEAGGTPGNVTLTTTNNFDNTGVSLSYGANSFTGSITNIGNVDITNAGGSGGSLTITAKPDVNGNANISSSVFIQMPKTNLTLMTMGALSTISTAQLATSSNNGGGNLTLITQGGDITTGDLFTDNTNLSNSAQNAGNLEITTGSSSINGGNITTGNIKSSSYTDPLGAMFNLNTRGKGGNVTVSSVGATSSGYVHVGTIATEGDRGGGNVLLVSEFADVSTQAISTFEGARIVGFIGTVTPDAGDVTISAGTTIYVLGAINANADVLYNGLNTLTARTSAVGGTVQLTSAGTTALTGAITVTGDIITYGDFGAGSVIVTSIGGDIHLGNILSQNIDFVFPSQPIQYTVGSVYVSTGTLFVPGGMITVGNINTSSLEFRPGAGNTAGDVTLASTGNSPGLGSITIQGDIDTIGRVANGNVLITTRQGNVEHSSGQIRTGLLSLMSFTGNFGTQPGLGGRAITTAASSLEFQTVGDVFVDQTGDLTIEQSTVSNFPFNSRVEIVASGSIYLNGAISTAEFLSLVSGADILNAPAMSGQFTLNANQIILQATGTIGTSSDYIKVRSSSGVTATSPNFIEQSPLPSPFPPPPPPPPPQLGLSPTDSLSFLESNIIATEANDLGVLDEGGTSNLEHQIVANSNINFFQGGAQVTQDIQVASHNSLDSTINSANFMGGAGPNTAGNQPPLDDQALGQNFAFCDAGNFNSDTQSQMQSHGATIGQQSTANLCVLQQGNFLFQPHSDITVQVQEGSVEIPNGATALVMETGNDVAVFDISDSPKARVRVKSGNKIITMSPGKQVVLTRQLDADFDKINPSKLIGYKNPKGELVASDIRAYSADFSLPSVMMSVAPMKRMLTSDSPADRKLVQRMIKNAVVLSMLPSKSGPFKTSGNNHP